MPGYCMPRRGRGIAMRRRRRHISTDSCSGAQLRVHQQELHHHTFTVAARPGGARASRASHTGITLRQAAPAATNRSVRCASRLTPCNNTIIVTVVNMSAGAAVGARAPRAPARLRQGGCTGQRHACRAELQHQHLDLGNERPLSVRQLTAVSVAGPLVRAGEGASAAVPHVHRLQPSPGRHPCMPCVASARQPAAAAVAASVAAPGCNNSCC